MSDASNPRLISTDDPEVLRRELAALDVSSERQAALFDRLPCLAVALEALPAGAAAALSDGMSRLGGAGFTGRHERGEVAILLGSRAQLRALGGELAGDVLAGIVKDVEGAIDRSRAPRGATQIGQSLFQWGARTYVMGVVNVTPDSFSGDGLSDVAAAVNQAEWMVETGADLIDVGGESTRPRSERVDAAEELRRVLPVVKQLARDLPVPVSIDTAKAAVAQRCLDAGAAMVNDVWGLRADPAMASLVARYNVPVVLMHNQHGLAYGNLLADVLRVLRQSIALGRGAGIPEEHLIVDPGIGFGKSKEHNLELLHRLAELEVLGRPILLGTSRKSTIGLVLNLPPEERVEGTAATVALGIAQGADVVRVHDVREMVRVCRMSDAVVRWHPPAEGIHQWPGQTG